jgi:hypothetical protein
MRNLSRRQKILILVSVFAATLIAVLFVPPIPQDPGYHQFADKRPLLGMPNFGNVVSNAGFAVVGLLGLAAVVGPRRRAIFDNGPDAAPYLVFFVGVGLVSAGSSYYHLAPDTGRLLWDRLPMTLAFTSLFAAIIADRIDRKAGIFCLLPVLVAAGLASVLYWAWTEAQGHGDLRFYGVVQFFPMAALCVILWLFPAVRYTSGVYLLWTVAWYGGALALDYFDDAVFALLGGAVSGHTLKHLVAAVATFVVLRMIERNAAKQAPDCATSRRIAWR